jgi:hypothetical protein
MLETTSNKEYLFQKEEMIKRSLPQRHISLYETLLRS